MKLGEDSFTCWDTLGNIIQNRTFGSVPHDATETCFVLIFDRHVWFTSTMQWWRIFRNSAK